MAYDTLTAQQASDSEYTLDAMTRVKGVLDANRAVLTAGGRTVHADAIQIGLWHVVQDTPAIRIGVRRSRDDEYTLGSSAQNTRTIDLIVVVVDRRTGDGSALDQNVAELADRVRETLLLNWELDDGNGAWAFGLSVPDIQFGREQAAGSYVGAAHITVRVEKHVDRPT